MFNSFFSQAIDFILKNPTPTVNNPLVRELTEKTPPVGWTIAGFLILLLMMMIYQQIKKYILERFRKKRPARK
ncbi:hypothetical protein [Anaerolinea thermolimosa]|uniref:hypothetical protein n=1 Tax=Anaerolinea thermolimosa TaxID=229919 RepID=UPI0007854305|nr:hypothetical protein [Anaerolinea thermolimosa]